MRRTLALLLVLGVTAAYGAAVEPGQTWLLGSPATLYAENRTVALRPGDQFEVLEVAPPWVTGRCRRGDAVAEGRLPLAALATALTAEQFETLRAAMSTYVYADDEAARTKARETVQGFAGAGFRLQELAASRVGLHVEDPPSGPQRLTVKVGEGVEAEYYLVLPRDYDASRTYPLIVSFHGMGGTGTYSQHWTAGNVEGREPFIVIAPTSADPQHRQWWCDDSGELIAAGLRATIRDYAVDPWRVYAEGFSMGGVAATFWPQTWPDRFAAIGAQAACFWRDEHDVAGSVENVRLVPAFLAVGENDARGNVGAFKRLDEELTRLKTPHVFKLLANTGHSFGGQEDELLAFLLKYQRNLAPRAIAYNVSRFPGGRLMPEWVYWVRLREASHQGRIEAQVQGNTIQIKTTRVQRFDVYVNDWLVDLDKPVSVLVNRRSVHAGRVARDVFTMLDVIRETGDPARLFSATIEVRVR